MKLKSIALVLCGVFVGILFSFGCGGGTEAAAPYITGISKTSSTTAGTTNISLIFTFNESMATYDLPTVTVEGVVQANIAAGKAQNGTADCSFNDAGTTYTCTVEISNCRELHDYEVSISNAIDVNGVAVPPMIFDSADDEFDNADSLSNCWDQSGSQYATPTIDTSTDTLQWNFHTGDWGMDLVAANIAKGFTAIAPIAVTMRVLENEMMGTNLIGLQMNPDIAGESGAYRVFANGGFVIEEQPELPVEKAFFVMLTNTDDAGMAVYAPSPVNGAWETIGDYSYFCVVKIAKVFRFYASTDGRIFTQMSNADTMLVETAVEPPLTVEAQWPFELAPILRLFTYNPVVSSGYDPKIDYIRFRTKNLIGTEADCPAAYLAP